MSKDKSETKEETVEVENEISPEDIESTDENDREQVSNKLVSLDDTAMKMSIISKITEIDRLYKKGVIQYTETVHRYNIEIEKLKSEIELESKKNSEEQRVLFSVESILEYECKLFESLHHKFTQKMESLIELREEYKESLEESIYNEKFSRKERELFICIDEIEEKEIALLNQELEKINLSNILGKKLKKVEELTRSLKELELEKSYFESTGLNQISNLKIEHQTPNEVVDTVIMDEK